MERLALYRKYRSADFDQIVGQNHVTKTLKAALKKGFISHAYLFTGPRGVGKTSVARILARNINGLEPKIDMNSLLDIIEIDAASNRGIDEIRSLREKISSAPTSLKYKIYIIDEVHMLTKEAFNALLKTLEEPPAHAIFILATTEAHKLPDTVISRTQRFDFHPISQNDLVTHLDFIAKEEKIDVTKGSLEIIARSSKGGFRDAISLLDQLSAFESKIDEELVYQLLGLSSEDSIVNLAKSINNGDKSESITNLDNILQSGNDPINLTNQLLEHFRRGLLYKERLISDSSLDYFEEVDYELIIKAIDYLTKALADFKTTNHYSLPLEIAVYKLASRNDTDILPPPAENHKESRKVKQIQKSSPQAVADTDKIQQNKYTTQITKGFSLIKEKNNSLYALIRSANPTFKDDKLILNCRFRFHLDRLEDDKNRDLIESMMSKAFDKKISLKCQLTNQPNIEESKVDKESELISSALEILGGEVING
ncbi:MAG: DNA polymerase III subunit gamma/tau [bacterium]|nr:DNA polymerase III subunit gamma/tau [bacterium]